MTNPTRNILLGLFFVSGATALVYQVIWSRLLTLFFGSTTLAVSTVLAAFMGGLALGSGLLGRRADAVVRPLRLYAWLELFIGLYALATPRLFAAGEDVFVALYEVVTPGFWGSALLRFALALLLLLPPTILMGGTFPVLSRLFLAARGETAGTLSVLYFVNTAGAMAGTLAAGLILLRWLGTDLLLLAGGAANIGIFALAYVMAPATGEAPRRAPPARTAVRRSWSANAVLATATLFVSGLAALVYEVVWTRALTLVIGSSTYAFTIMLATVLGGIAAGSALVPRWARGRPLRLHHLAACQLLVGVFAFMTASGFGMLPDAFVSLFPLLGDRFFLLLAVNFLFSFVVMVPATLFMGASFPVAGAIVVERLDDSGRRVGLLYAGNTLGAILGAFLAGFVLVPTIGVHDTLMLTVAVNLLTGLTLLAVFVFREARARSFAIAAAALVLASAFVWRPEWDRLRMTSGPYVYAPQYQALSLDERLAGLELLFYREGPVATVSVIREKDHLRLVVDGKTDAGNFRDMSTQVLVGHLPFMIRPDAEDVLVVGYASGITAGAVARHAVKRIDTVEIEPAMREASAFFERENYAIADDERFTLVIDDARSFAVTTDNTYDVIISEPSNPWQSGSSRLFTREAILRLSRLLKKGGVMVQWMHLYGIDVEMVRLVARTFVSVFPNAAVWADPSYSDLFFMGSRDSIAIDPATIARLYRDHPEVRQSLARIGYTEDWALLKTYLLGPAELQRYAGPGPLNTDDRPLLEFGAPRSLYKQTAVADNTAALVAARVPEPFPEIRVGDGEKAEVAALLADWGEALAEAGDGALAKGAIAGAAALAPDLFRAHFQLGSLRMLTSDTERAIAAFERALGIDSLSGAAHANLGTLYLQSGRDDDAYRHLRTAILLDEDSSSIRNNLAVILARKDRLAAAVSEAEAAVSLDPTDRVAAKNLSRFRKLLEDRGAR